ncbi:hypothetical protein [Hymenobacter nivis]|uniref:hypothetical protein n=1 Tax=Hymenobacter nivis TaxID=1850093 RepID=UPI00112A5B54|nr:hypothetical protein [Hymenobacter nivis]
MKTNSNPVYFFSTDKLPSPAERILKKTTLSPSVARKHRASSAVAHRPTRRKRLFGDSLYQTAALPLTQ